MIQSNLNPARTARFVTPALTAATVSFCASLSGCSGEGVNMGQNDVTPHPLPSWSRCLESSSIEGDVIVRNQEELAALEGCEVIEGRLYIEGFEGADLRPLHALTTVRGPLELQAADEALQAVTKNHWLESLRGLESLESVGGLLISGYGGRDVDPLGNLRVITDGWLYLSSNFELEGLDGLRNARGIHDLRVFGCPALESIALSLREEMTNLWLSNSGISHLDLDVVIVSEDLSIDYTQLRNLDGLSNLVEAGSIHIEGNASLENIDGLNALSGAGALHIEGNGRLTRLPDFSDLLTLDSLRVLYQWRLTALPVFPRLPPTPFLLDHLAEHPEDLIAHRPDLIEIVGNRELRALTLPPGWLSGAAVLIEQNPALAHIDFTEQSFIDYLSIRSNAVLGSVGLGALEAVNHLEVADNPNLPPSTFDSVRTLQTHVAGDAAHP